MTVITGTICLSQILLKFASSRIAQMLSSSPPTLLSALNEAVDALHRAPSFFRLRQGRASIVEQINPAEQSQLFDEGSPLIAEIAQDLRHQTKGANSAMRIVDTLENIGVHFIPVPRDSRFTGKFAAVGVYLPATNASWLLLDGGGAPTPRTLLQAYAHFLDKGMLSIPGSEQFVNAFSQHVEAQGYYASVQGAPFTEAFPAAWLSFSGYRAFAKCIRSAPSEPLALDRILGISPLEAEELTRILREGRV